MKKKPMPKKAMKMTPAKKKMMVGKAATKMFGK